MNPSDRGWLRAYLTFRARALKQGNPCVAIRANHDQPDIFAYLYRLIQPTGLLYGYPVRFIETPHPLVHEWSEKDKLKVLLAEGFLSLGLHDNKQQDGLEWRTLAGIIDETWLFYNQNNQLYGYGSKRVGQRRKHNIDKLEYLLDRRINIQYDWRNPWTSFFHNSLLVFDLFFFATIRSGHAAFGELTLKQLGLKLRLHILKIIAASAHSDGYVSDNERDLFKFFLQSAHLPAPQKKIAARFIREGVSLEELDSPEFSSWIFKKYFLELAILTAWAKQELVVAETQFLGLLAQRLELTEDEFAQSLMAVEQFVKGTWNQVHYLQFKHNYRIVSERFIDGLRLVVRKNQRMIGREISESRELVYLLRQSSTRELTPLEKDKIRDQLVDILRSIPAAAIWLLPGGSITLPILLRIMPRHILYPSSFRENETDYRDV